MKYLPPLVLKDEYFSEIEKEVQRVFDREIFLPIVQAMGGPENEIMNAVNDPLVKAVANGIVWFENGRFHGKYNSSISRRLKQIGARYNKLSNTWSFDGPLPPDISIAQVRAEERFQDLRKSILKSLNDISRRGIQGALFEQLFDKTLNHIEADFLKTIKAIGVVPNMSEGTKRRISQEWSENLNLYVKDWVAEDILDLREKVEQNTFEGRRAADLVGLIQDNYGSSKSKAKFLARQETSLLMSKYRETRYTELGMNDYVWDGAMDEKERPDHKKLQGKVFSWDNPPITNEKTGDRNHPGEDYNCRCVAIPIIR